LAVAAASSPKCVLGSAIGCSNSTTVDFEPTPLGALTRRIMETEWNDSQPIYRQLRDRVVHMILDGTLKEGDPLPSVRTVAADYRVNPLTVLKGYQQLVDESLVEKRRGMGMYVLPGARKSLLKDERQKFIDDEWPTIVATIQRLGLQPQDLLAGIKNDVKQSGEDA
jgi:GntR family transcriptional regulator